MEAKTQLEYKELLKRDDRLHALCNVVLLFKDDPKALNACARLIKIEQTAVQNSKAPVTTSDLHALMWRYADFMNIVKRMRCTKDAIVYGKAIGDLDDLIEKTVAEERTLEAKLREGDEKEKDGSVISETKRNRGEKIASDAGKIQQAVQGTAEQIKNFLAGGDNAK